MQTEQSVLRDKHYAYDNSGFIEPEVSGKEFGQEINSYWRTTLVTCTHVDYFILTNIKDNILIINQNPVPGSPPVW